MSAFEHTSLAVLVLLLAALGAGAFTSACSAPRTALNPPLATLSLRGSDGRDYDLAREVARHRLTVFVFYSQGCPCLAAHEPRLAALHRDYQERGVALFLVNSEVDGTAEGDAAEARRRALPFPLLTDKGARLARSVHAQYATQSVVVDSTGRVVYSGGLDSDKNRLKPSAVPYLRNALDELLATGSLSSAEHEALGCDLQLD